MTLNPRRALVRVSAVTAFAAGALTLAGPAFAAPGAADLELTTTGNTVAATASGKANDITVTNHGPSVATGVQLVADLSKLDTAVVDVPTPEGCDTKGKTLVCGVGDIKVGASFDLYLTLVRKGKGKAGELTFTVSHAGADANSKNDSKTVAVAVAESSGPDLYAFVPDVPLKEGSITPGSTGKMLYEIGNQGDRAVTGFKLTVTLPPKHVTFAEVEKDCTYNAANTVAKCVYEKFPLIPADEDKNDEDEVYSAGWFYHELKVAAGAPAPSHLAGGTVSVEPIVAADQPEGPSQIQGFAATALPPNATGKHATDVDDTDNTDEFAISVSAPKPGGGGGTGGTGELPVTGVQTGLIGLAGLGVLAAGGALLVAARRRRIVLVNPGDE